MTELMDRLTRANPVPPTEAPTAEEEREADALLERLLADQPAPKPPGRPSFAPRRVVPAAVLLAVAAITTAVVIDLAGSEQDRDGGIIERAAAAVSQEDVIYAVTERQTVTSVSLTPGVAATPDQRGIGRYWLWAGGGRSRFLMYHVRPDGSRGRLESEIASDRKRLRWFIADSNTISVSQRPTKDWPAPPEDSGFPGFDPFSDPGAQLRAHVDKGTLRVAGRTTVRGHAAYRLVSRPRMVPGAVEDEKVTYLVDARTYLPLELRMRVVLIIPEGGGDPEGRERVLARMEYLRYERLPVTDENKALLRMGEHPGARVYGGP